MTENYKILEKFIKDISAETPNLETYIFVRDHIHRYKLDIDINSKVLKEKILEMLSLRANASFIEANITSDINLMKEFYRSLGYYFVKIETEIVRLDKNRVNISFLINKGKKAKIAKIYFLGEKKLERKN